MGPRSWRSPKRVFAVFMGGAALLRGVAYLWPETVPSGLSTLSMVPGGLVTWGWVWTLVGIVSVWGAVASRTAPLIPFAAVNLLWGGSYLAEWVRGWWETGEVSREWITSVSYLALGVATLTVIRLIDPAEVRDRAGRGRDE